jgi:hypothetical protein
MGKRKDFTTPPPGVRVIGKRPSSHGRPSPRDEYTGAPGGSVGFAGKVRQEGLPRYTESNDPHAYRILRTSGDWPRTTRVDATFKKPVVKAKPVTVSYDCDGKIRVTVGPVPVPEGRAPKTRSMTKKEARGTWNPAIGSEPMLPVTHPSVPCLHKSVDRE